MNYNIWNIKDMFSIPSVTGTNKSSGHNSAPSDYSSLTDSQFLFGSQLCQDISQPTSMEFSVQSRQQKHSQQNSQDSDPSIFQKYQSRPALFCGDMKEKGTLHFGAGKSKGTLEQFEEDKKKAKDKHDSEVFNNLFHHIQESIQGLRTSFTHFEEQANSREKSTVDQYEHISKALQENADYYASILNALKAKTTTEQALLDMEQKLLTKYTEITELKSSLQLLKECFEVLKTEQCEQYLKLSEQLKWLTDQLQYENILSELQKLISAAKPPIHLKDSTSQTELQKLTSAHKPPSDMKASTSQTSPTLIHDLCLVSQEKTYLKTTKVCQRSTLQTQPYVTLSPSKHVDYRVEGQVTKPIAYRSDLKTAAIAHVDPSTISLNGKEKLNKTASSCLESQVPCNQMHSGSSLNGQFSQNMSESQWQFANDHTQVTATVNVTSNKKEKNTVNPLKQSHMHEQKYQTGNTDHYIPTKNTIQNTGVEYKHKSGKPKKPRKSKMIMRKRKAGFSERKIKTISKAIPNNVQKQTSCETSDTWENFTRNDSQKDSSNNSKVYYPSSMAVSQETVWLSQYKKPQSSIPMASSNQCLEVPTVKTEEIPGNSRCNISKKEKQLLQWDNSSQDSSLFHCNVKRGNQMSWFSPSSPLLYNTSHSMELNTDCKSTFHSISFDSSDDSS